MKDNINYFGSKLQSLLNELRENDISLLSTECNGHEGFLLLSKRGETSYFFPVYSSIPICPVTIELKNERYFYWAFDTGVEEYIFDRFEYRDEADGFPLAVYGWNIEADVVLGKASHLLGVISLDAFNRYIFLNKEKAELAATKFMGGLSD